MTLECTEVIVFPGAQREEFPFQWGDSQAVPMEDDAGGAADASANDYMPPLEPHEH